MRKIIILGSSGAGKSTLAKALGSTLNIKTFHLDRLFWTCGWERKTTRHRIDLMEKLIFGNKQWIIEGNYVDSLGPALKEADTMIFLDIHPLLCLLRVLMRHFAYAGQFRRDIPEGCTDRLTLPHLWKVLIFPFHGRRKIERCLFNFSFKRIILLRSPKEVQDFITEKNIVCIKVSLSSIMLIL